jgi:hypothetical protein
LGSNQKRSRIIECSLHGQLQISYPFATIALSDLGKAVIDPALVSQLP